MSANNFIQIKEKGVVFKNFNSWNTQKKNIHDFSDQRVFFHEREVWWCSLGLNVGHEQDGKGDAHGRPVIIFKKFNNEVFWAIPLSTVIKKHRYYIKVDLGDKVDRVAIISQVRLVDAKRLYQRVGWLPIADYKKVKGAVLGIIK